MDHRTTTAPAVDDRFDVALRGLAVGPETRCRHWHGECDVVAFRFACCESYYPCVSCHVATTGHERECWPADRFGDAAVFCGVCRTELSVASYLDCGDNCPACGTAFNPGCRTHHHLYFDRQS